MSIIFNSTDDLNDTLCKQNQVESRTSRLLFRYLFPFILTSSVAGNIANVILYRHKFLKSSPTVRMLAAKAICNMLFCCSMIPNFIFACHLPLNSGQQTIPALNGDKITGFYWFSLKYVLFTSNVLSTAAIWLTVAVTAEHFTIITFPVRGKTLSTTRNAHLTIFLVFPCSVALHVFYLIARNSSSYQCWYKGNLHQVYFFYAVNNTRVYSNVYSLANSMLMYLIPTITLVFFSAMIYNRLFRQGTQFQTNTEQKQCVTRLALGTTVCHMLFELPMVVINTLILVHGDIIQKFTYQAEVIAVANMLSLMNTSIPFFVYLTCSRRFRQLAVLLFCRRCIHLTQQDVQLLLANSNAIMDQRFSLTESGQKRFSIITQSIQLRTASSTNNISTLNHPSNSGTSPLLRNSTKESKL